MKSARVIPRSGIGQIYDMEKICGLMPCLLYFSYLKDISFSVSVRLRLCLSRYILQQAPACNKRDTGTACNHKPTKAEP